MDDKDSGAPAQAMDDHVPFSLIPFDAREMTYEEYCIKFQAFCKEKLAIIWGNIQAMNQGRGQW